MHTKMKIVGEWDGETIWRPETAEEKFLRKLLETTTTGIKFRPVEVDLPTEEEAKIAVDYQLGEAH